MSNPITLVKTREKLQELSHQRYGAFTLRYGEHAKFLDSVWHDMRQSFAARRTLFAFDPNKYFTKGSELSASARLELITLLKAEYIGCDISNFEVILGSQCIENLIIINWS
jgi:hypothetical protein